MNLLEGDDGSNIKEGRRDLELLLPDEGLGVQEGPGVPRGEGEVPERAGASPPRAKSPTRPGAPRERAPSCRIPRRPCPCR
eukprot:7090036-Alexandrium_andersonii.AAC.1